MPASNRQSFQFGLRGVLLFIAILCAGLGLGISFAILVLVAYVAYLKFVNGEVKHGWLLLEHLNHDIRIDQHFTRQRNSPARIPRR